jgi:hypothetical protein
MLTAALLDVAPTFRVSEFKDVRRSLLGRVFHVTRLSSMSSILASGGLLPNRMGYKSPLGDAADGYFRSIGCVSFFDYRKHETKEWRKFHRACEPNNVIHHNDPAVVMFLGTEHHDKLLDWAGWRKQTQRSVVPHVEVGFPGQVELHMITEVRIWEDANPERSRILERIYQQASEGARRS